MISRGEVTKGRGYLAEQSGPRPINDKTKSRPGSPTPRQAGRILDDVEMGNPQAGDPSLGATTEEEAASVVNWRGVIRLYH